VVDGGIPRGLLLQSEGFAQAPHRTAERTHETGAVAARSAGLVVREHVGLPDLVLVSAEVRVGDRLSEGITGTADLAAGATLSEWSKQGGKPSTDWDYTYRRRR
jgi:hypothetical protein